MLYPPVIMMKLFRAKKSSTSLFKADWSSLNAVIATIISTCGRSSLQSFFAILASIRSPVLHTVTATISMCCRIPAQDFFSILPRIRSALLHPVTATIISTCCRSSSYSFFTILAPIRSPFFIQRSPQQSAYAAEFVCKFLHHSCKPNFHFISTREGFVYSGYFRVKDFFDH